MFIQTPRGHIEAALALGATRWEVVRTTVLRVMQRLEAKGLLVRVPGAGPVRFRAAVEEGCVLPALIRRFIDRVLGGSPEPLVAFLADSEKLSAKDLEALRTIARKIAGEPKEQ